MSIEGVVHDDDPGSAKAHCAEAFTKYVTFRIREDRRAMHHRHSAAGTLRFKPDQMRMNRWVSLDDRIVNPRMYEGGTRWQSAWQAVEVNMTA